MMSISNLKRTWTNTALFEFGLAKSCSNSCSDQKISSKTISYFWFHPPGPEGPFTRWVNNKLKQHTSHLYFIFFITFKIAPSYVFSENALRSWWQQPMGKSWDLQCQNGTMTHISRKTKSRRQHAFFLWPVKYMLRISNLLLHLTKITCFQKHIDGLLTDM